MITEKESRFLQYWEQNRENEKTFVSKLTRGLPMAIIFALPIILSVIVVKLFFPDWNSKMSEISPGLVVTAFVATVLVVLFYSFFRMQYKWEMNEQLYQEIKAKEKKQTLNS